MQRTVQMGAIATDSMDAFSGLTDERGASSNRILGFDFTKGTLVLFMVLYHWLNYFYGPQGEIYKYLRFLTPSFIFITGFLISHVHLAKYGVGSARLAKRLFFRGVKLFAVFIALNLVISLLEPESFVRSLLSSRSIAASLDTVFFTAKISVAGMGKIAAFGILVPISYLLMLSAALSLACRFFKHTFHLVSVILLAALVGLGFRGIQSGNLELVTIGLLGVVFGYVSKAGLQRVVSSSWLLVLAYCLYLVIVSMCDVPIYVQMIGAILTTALIYAVGVQAFQTGPLHEHVILLGKYSLVGYIAQIAILQLLHAALRDIKYSWAGLGGSLFAAFALTMLSVKAVDLGRAMSKTIDGAYKIVFA
jgi:peptidoglycan/LPS O-acetylase OafA/YrhL